MKLSTSPALDEIRRLLHKVILVYTLLFASIFILFVHFNSTALSMHTNSNVTASLQNNSFANKSTHTHLSMVTSNSTPPRSSYGFTLHKNFDDNALSDYLDLHAGWVRITDEWDEIETSPNIYNWSDLDTMVQLANAHNIKVDYVVWRAPQFRAGLRCVEDNNTLFGPNVGTDYVASPTETANFAGLVASRYNGTSGHGRIDAIEILNEFPFAFNDPANSAAHDACVDPKYYTQILPPSYSAVKDNSAANPILVGMDSIFSQNAYYLDWLSRFYAHGTKKYFDFVNLHYYNNSSEPDPSVTNGQYLSFHDAINQIHLVMQNNGDGNKPIWVTEFGWATQPAANQSTSSYYVNPAQQAHNLQYVLTTAKAANFIANMFFYTINTQAPYPASYGDCWQDIKINCNDKPNYSRDLPAYTVFKQFISANPTLGDSKSTLSGSVQKVGTVQTTTHNNSYYLGYDAPTFEGRGTPGATIIITIYSNAIVLKTKVNGNGNWSVSAPHLSDGVHELLVQESDNAGNTLTLAHYSLGINYGLALTNTNLVVLVVGGGLLIIVGLAVSFIYAWRRYKR